jgi:hypothetical protein
MVTHSQEVWEISGVEQVLKFGEPAQGITLFDGKNFIIPVKKKNTGSHVDELIVVEFWGAYQDRNNELDVRWKEDEVDLLTIAGEGPRFRIIKRIPLRFVNENIQVFYLENKNNEIWVHAIATNPTYFVLSKATYEFTGKFSTPLPGNDLPIVSLPDENGVLFMPESKIYAFGGFRWAVGLAPLKQFGEDRQKLYRYTMSGSAYVYAGFTYIPGRKQFNPREMAFQWGKVWVTGFNTSSIHGFDVTNGAFFTSVSVNRDVSKITAKNNKLYTLSRGDLCHEISEALNVAPVGDKVFYDALNAVHVLPQQYWEDVGAAWWRPFRLSNAEFFLENIRKSDYLIQRWRTEKECHLVAYNPPMVYEYFDGSNFNTVNVYEYVLVGERVSEQTDSFTVNLKAYRLRDFYRGTSELNHSGYAAISLGPLSYKGDNC